MPCIRDAPEHVELASPCLPTTLPAAHMVQPTHMCLGRLSLCVQMGALATKHGRLLGLQPRLGDLGECYGRDGRREVGERSFERNACVRMHVLAMTDEVLG